MKPEPRSARRFRPLAAVGEFLRNLRERRQVRASALHAASDELLRLEHALDLLKEVPLKSYAEVVASGDKSAETRERIEQLRCGLSMDKGSLAVRVADATQAIEQEITLLNGAIRSGEHVNLDRLVKLKAEQAKLKKFSERLSLTFAKHGL